MWRVSILARDSWVYHRLGRPQGVSTLTPDPDRDLSRIRTRRDLGMALRALSKRAGLSLSEIEKRTREWTDPRQELKRSTISEAFNGKRLISRPALLSLLSVCGVEADAEQQPWFDARARAAYESQVGAGTFDAASPRDLGIHNAIVASDTTDDLPAYVTRDFDFRLHTALGLVRDERGCFVILVGGSSTGKTRSLYEAVYATAPGWSLIVPRETQDVLELMNEPPRRTIVWLDELKWFLGSHPPLSSECVRALIRRGNIVVGTLWPDQYDARVAARQPESSEADDVRRLLKSATVISVPDTLTEGELRTAGVVAEQDSRIRIALGIRDVGLTQALAGGPALVLRWEQAPNAYAKAIITAAGDAHRLGVQSPLPPDLLAEAMFGYLRPDQRVRPKEVWLAEAVPHATESLDGDVSPLSAVDDGRAGTFAGYVMADYLAQHLRQFRRTACVPHEAWQALVTKVGRSADLRRLADSAVARLRYRYAERALDRLVREFGDGTAAIELADMLIRQDRFARAIDVLSRRLAVDPRDRTVGRHLSRTQELWQRVAEIRPAADAGDPVARGRLFEILADGGVCDDLRARAATGDVVAAEDLVERLAARGCVRDLHRLADEGYGYAAEVLADLYVAWGELDRLQARANAGDEAAKLRLSKVHEEGVRTAGTGTEVAELRAAAASDPESARRLCTLLFELRDLGGLRAELEAGTYGAADRLVALYTAEESLPPDQLVSCA